MKGLPSTRSIQVQHITALTFYSVLADLNTQPFLFKPEYTAAEMQQVSVACAYCIMVHMDTAGTDPGAGELRFLSQYSRRRGIYCFN